jgi:hypothetical protein
MSGRLEKIKQHLFADKYKFMQYGEYVCCFAGNFRVKDQTILHEYSKSLLLNSFLSCQKIENTKEYIHLKLNEY